jgi:hypothetical protein
VAQEVDICDLDTGGLAQPQAGERRQRDERLELRLGGFEDCPDLSRTAALGTALRVFGAQTCRCNQTA